MSNNTIYIPRKLLADYLFAQNNPGKVPWCEKAALERELYRCLNATDSVVNSCERSSQTCNTATHAALMLSELVNLESRTLQKSKDEQSSTSRPATGIT